MDIFSLIAACRVLKVGGIREAARTLSCPPSTVSAAFARLEDDLAIRLAERTGTRFILTLEGRRLVNRLATVAGLAEGLCQLARPASTEAGFRAVSISLQALERFVAVARAGSVRRAARTAGVGQPQLSRQMSGLEDQLGTMLLRRSVDGVDLTPVGSEVLIMAEDLLEIWKGLSDKAPDRFLKSLSTLRLGSIMPLGYESGTARLLAKLAASGSIGSARTSLMISNSVTQDLLAGLHNGRFDVAILDTLPAHTGLESRVIYRSPLVLVAHRQFFEQFQGSIADLMTGLPLAVTSLKSGLRQKLTEIMDSHLAVDQKEKVKILEIDSLPTIINLVIDYGYASVLPKSSVEYIEKDLRYAEFSRDLDLELTLVWPATAAARRAAGLVLTWLGESGSAGPPPLAGNP